MEEKVRQIKILCLIALLMILNFFLGRFAKKFVKMRSFFKYSLNFEIENLLE